MISLLSRAPGRIRVGIAALALFVLGCPDGAPIPPAPDGEVCSTYQDCTRDGVTCGLVRACVGASVDGLTAGVCETEPSLRVPCRD